LEVRPKKYLGQHFLKDENIAAKIVRQLSGSSRQVLEIGPGTGVLTKHLIGLQNIDLYCIDTDKESVEYLQRRFAVSKDRFIHADFLNYDASNLFEGNYSIIGNFPYNISSQIFFRILDSRGRVDEVVCMIQKEVAERIASPPGSKRYGILSVILQAFYDINYLFQVNENVFIPPPKVKSAVIRLTRNNTQVLDCNEELFFEVVKAAFNQRRKTLRNSLKSFVFEKDGRSEIEELLSKRPEQLTVREFLEITKRVV
jgi:16S rRNA (adenine1518-N6/adenine1519-N6)-dimethyltransferase